MSIFKALLALVMAVNLALPVTAYAGGLGKVLGKSLAKRLFRDEARRDAATVARHLTDPRTVFRYTSKARAERELRQGLERGRHMTSRGGAGRPLSPEAAQRRYGLPERPEVRETIRLPEGFPARHNRAWFGERGVGEITSPRRVPPENITSVPLD